MRRLSRILSALLAFPLLLAPIARAENAWTEVRSEHFTVVTDAGEKKGRDVALRLEQMRVVFGLITNRSQVNIPVPVTVIAFKSTKEMRQSSPLFKGKPIELSGYFQKGDDRNYIALDLSANNAIEATLHEYAHMLLNGNYPEMPLWFDEGFAQYYETVNVDKRKVTVGMPPENVGYVLFGSADLAPVEAILQVQHASKDYNESGGRRNMFYAQSWLMVHYLFEKQMLKQMSDYAYLVQAQHVLPAEAWPRAFGMTPAEFRNRLRPYMKGRVQYTIYELNRVIDAGAFQARTLTPVEAQVALAELHLHLQDYQAKAVEELEAALVSDPNNASAHGGLGYAYLRRGEWDRAAANFHEAVKGGSQDAHVLYYSALLTQMRGHATDDDLKMMRDHAARAVQLDPDFADAYEVLAYAESGLGNLDAGASAMRKAVALSPRNEQYAIRLGQFLMAQKKWDEAAALFTRVQDSSDSAIAAQGRDALDMIQKAKGMKDVRVTLRGNYVQMAGEEEDAAPLRVRSGAAPASVIESDDDRPPAEPQPAPPAHVQAIDFLKGMLVSVDCSSTPAATLTVSSGGKTWTFQTADREHLILMGVDSFSCAWKNRKVAVNYRSTGANAGNLVSLELQ